MVFKVRSLEKAARFLENELPWGRAPEYQKDFLNHSRPGRLGDQITFRIKDYQGIIFPELLKSIWNMCAV